MSSWPLAVLIGDSQTQLGWQEGGWVAGLADTFQRRVDILNRGFSGYNTRMLLEVLPDLLSKEDWGKAKAVVILIGSNDASFPETNPEQAVPLEEFGENLLKIVAYLLSQGVKKEALVLVSPPPVLPDVWTAHLNNQPGPAQANCKSEALTAGMAKEVGEVAKRLGATFVDLHTALMGPEVNLRAALRFLKIPLDMLGMFE